MNRTQGIYVDLETMRNLDSNNSKSEQRPIKIEAFLCWLQTTDFTE